MQPTVFVSELKIKSHGKTESTQAKEISLRGIKILVVDESVDNQYLMKTVLTLKA